MANDTGKKFGGRKKGALNKRTTLSVGYVLNELGKKPVDEVLKLLPRLPPVEQARVWLKLQEYIEPKAMQPIPEDEEDEEQRDAVAKLFTITPKNNGNE